MRVLTSIVAQMCLLFGGWGGGLYLVPGAPYRKGIKTLLNLTTFWFQVFNHFIPVELNQFEGKYKHKDVTVKRKQIQLHNVFSFKGSASMPGSAMKGQSSWWLIIQH